MNLIHTTKDFELDIIYSYIDYLLKREQFLIVDALLRDLCMYVKTSYFRNAKLTKDEILGYLTCCFPAQSELNNYGYFYNNVKSLFAEEELAGLRPKE